MNGLVVFVEGAADGWFVLRSLGQLAAGVFDARKPADLPTPFGKSPGLGQQSHQGLILSWHARASLEDLALASSAEGHEPVFQAVAKLPARSGTDELMIFVVRMGGDRKHRETLKLIDSLQVTFGSGLQHDVKRLALAFVFDADTPTHYEQPGADGVASRESWFTSTYQPLVGSGTARHGAWESARPCPWGLFVLHDAATRCGTLEDLVGPALRGSGWEHRLNEADTYLQNHAVLNSDVLSKASERTKAQLTIAGQPFKPGDSLAQIIKRGAPKDAAVIPDAVFGSSAAQELVRFLTNIIW